MLGNVQLQFKYFTTKYKYLTLCSMEYKYSWMKLNGNNLILIIFHLADSVW